MTNSVLDPNTGMSASDNRTDIDIADGVSETVILRVDTPFDGIFPGDVRTTFDPTASVGGELHQLVGNGIEVRNKGGFNDLERMFIAAFEGDGIDNVEVRVLDNRTVEFVTQFGDAAQDSIIVTGEFVESYFELLYGQNYIIDNNTHTIDTDDRLLDRSILDNRADSTTLVFNDDYGARITDSIKFGFGGKLGELGKALKGSNLDFRAGKTGDDLQRLLNEATEEDGFSLGNGNTITATVLDAETIKLTTNVTGAVSDEVLLTGEYIEGFLEDRFDNFVVGNDGFADDDLTREDFDVTDDVQETITVIVNQDYLTAHPNTVESNLSMTFSSIKGSELDLRTGGGARAENGDDLRPFLEDAFDFNKTDSEIGIAGVSAEVVNDFTVRLTFDFAADDANNDVMTVSGDWVEGWLADSGLDTGDFVHGDYLFA